MGQIRTCKQNLHALAFRVGHAQAADLINTNCLQLCSNNYSRNKVQEATSLEVRPVLLLELTVENVVSKD